jgi:hypothetical protein
MDIYDDIIISFAATSATPVTTWRASPRRAGHGRWLCSGLPRARRGGPEAGAAGQSRQRDGAFVAFLDIAYGISGPAAGVIAGQFGYAAVYLFGGALVVTAHCLLS